MTSDGLVKKLEALCAKWERGNGGSIPAEEARRACSRSIRSLLASEARISDEAHGPDLGEGVPWEASEAQGHDPHCASVSVGMKCDCGYEKKFRFDVPKYPDEDFSGRNPANPPVLEAREGPRTEREMAFENLLKEILPDYQDDYMRRKIEKALAEKEYPNDT